MSNENKSFIAENDLKLTFIKKKFLIYDNTQKNKSKNVQSKFFLNLTLNTTI